MIRITRDKLYTEIAQLFSQRSTCGRLQVGCVITRDGRIIASGYNGPPKFRPPDGRYLVKGSTEICKCDLEKPCERSIHAEANAISYSARNGIALEGTTMYCTHSPCSKCAELIIQAGIAQVVFVEHFRDEAGLQLLKDNNIQIRKHEPTE